MTSKTENQLPTTTRVASDFERDIALAAATLAETFKHTARMGEQIRLELARIVGPSSPFARSIADVRRALAVELTITAEAREAMRRGIAEMMKHAECGSAAGRYLQRMTEEMQKRKSAGAGIR
jgi:hypothetical protein